MKDNMIRKRTAKMNQDGAANMSGKCTSIEEGNASMNENFTSIEEGNASMNENCTSIEEGNASMNENFTSIEEGNASMNENFTSIEEGNASMNENFTSIEEGNASMNENFTSIEEGNASMKSKYAAKLGIVKLSVYFVFALTIVSWIFIFKYEGANLFELFSEKNLQYTKKFLAGLAGVGEETPAFLNEESWREAFKLSIDTLKMSIMAIGFATIITILTVIPAAKNVADGTLTLSKRWYGFLVYGFIRFSYIFSRSVPELIWAMIIIFIFKPGILPGAIALALHNLGILGKLCAEVIEDIDMRPIRSLASSGASKAQMFVYSVIPTVLPKFITFMLYRWEVIIRTTIVVGFVGAGGLGQEFKLSMSWFQYSDVTLFLISYVVLVVIADLISEGLRRAVQ